MRNEVLHSTEYKRYVIWVKLRVCGKRDLVFVLEGGVVYINC